jgi:dihydroneopterin aldolase
MGKISIHGLLISTTIGVYDFERTAPQSLRVDLEFSRPPYPAETTDQVDHTIDYAVVATQIRELAAASHFKLLEALGHAIVTHLRTHFPMKYIRLRLTKYGCIPSCDSVSIELEWPHS